MLVGHSLGGAAVLAAASQVPEAVAVATIGAPFDPAHVTELFPATVRDQLRRDGEADVQLAGAGRFQQRVTSWRSPTAARSTAPSPPMSTSARDSSHPTVRPMPSRSSADPVARPTPTGRPIRAWVL